VIERPAGYTFEAIRFSWKANTGHVAQPSQHACPNWKGAWGQQLKPVQAAPRNDGVQLSEAITGDGAAIFRHACGLGLEGIVSKRIGSRYSGSDKSLVEDEEPGFSTQVIAEETLPPCQISLARP
jgi:hypothetical protein